MNMTRSVTTCQNKRTIIGFDLTMEKLCRILMWCKYEMKDTSCFHSTNAENLFTSRGPCDACQTEQEWSLVNETQRENEINLWLMPDGVFLAENEHWKIHSKQKPGDERRLLNCLSSNTRREAENVLSVLWFVPRLWPKNALCHN